MEFEKFKEKCEQERQRHDEKCQIFQELFEKQGNNYLEKCFNPKQKFNWRKLSNEYFCPNCREKLEIEYIYRFWGKDACILSCKCGYEFAIWL